MLQKVEYGPDDYMDPSGSSLMGHITTDYTKLVELFGEPNCPPGDKTWTSWDLCFRVWDEDGELAGVRRETACYTSRSMSL